MVSTFPQQFSMLNLILSRLTGFQVTLALGEIKVGFSGNMESLMMSDQNSMVMSQSHP